MFDYDHSHYPVAWYRFWGETTVEDVERWASVDEEVMRRSQAEEKHIVTSTDASESVKISAQARHDFGEVLQAREGDLDTVQSVSVVVIKSAIVRGAMTALSWVSSAAKRSKAVKSVNEAVRYIKEECARLGLPDPSAQLEALLQEHYGDDVTKAS